MGFFFFSILSVFTLGIAYGLLLLLFWGIARLTRGVPGRKVLLAVAGAVFLVLPVAEEFWIAWNFGQLCKKDAGIFIHTTVEVEGFYDDTTHWWRQLGESKYQFMESRDNTYGGLFRVERDGNELRHFKIDRPTARYYFAKPHNHTIVAHKIKMFEYLVGDRTTNQILAREKTYAREAPWFFVGLDRPTRFCAVSGDYGERIYATLYDRVLKPAGRH